MVFQSRVECIRRFFKRRFKYESALYPRFNTNKPSENKEGDGFRLDVVVAASGFTKKDQKVLEEYMETVTGEEPRGNDEDADSEEEEESDTGEAEDEDGDDEGERERDGEVIGVRTQTEPGDEHENVLIDGRAPMRPGTGSGADLQGENRPPSRASTLLSQLSRSPPRSRSPSPDTLAKMTAALTLRSVDVRERVATDLAKRQRQQKKYHGRRGGGRAGRPQGSKAKQDQRVKLDGGGIWD